MTLGRAMMSRAPTKRATSRLIHNVDASWSQPSKHIITTVVGREVEAQSFPSKHDSRIPTSLWGRGLQM
jgi:hypothetical protein